MQKLKFINSKGIEIDLTSGSFGITEWEGFSNVELNLQTQQVPFCDGSVFLDGLLGERELSITLAIDDEKDMEKRYQLKRQLISVLNPKLGEGTLIYTNNFISKQIKAVPQIPLFENHNSNDPGTPKASLSWTCPSPYWEDLEETVLQFKGNAVVENNGDVPVSIKLKTELGAKNPTIINQTTGKKLSLTGEYGDSEIYIDSGFGKKTINNKIPEFEWNQGALSFNSSASSNEKTVYVSDQLVVVESLITGKFKTINLNTTLKKVSYNNGKFVAVGTKIFTSPDGENWTEVNFPSGVTGTLNSLYTYSQGFVAVGDNGLILESSDGVTCSLVTVLSLASINLYDIIVVAGYRVIVGAGGTVFVCGAWNQGSLNVITDVTEDLRSVVYSSLYEKVVAVGNSGRVIMASPPNLQSYNWTWSTSQISSTNLYSINTRSKEYFAVDTAGNFWKSSDGINWDFKFIDNVFLRDVNFSGGSIVIIGSNGWIIKSTDGENLDIVKMNIENAIMAICYSEEKELFVGVGSRGVIYTSKDAIKWTLQHTDLIPGNLTALVSIVYSKKLKLFVVVGRLNTSTGLILTSPDGENWTVQSSSISARLTSIAYSEEKELFVVVGNNGLILTSPDAIDWTSQTSEISNPLSKIIYSKKLGIFVAVTSNSAYCIKSSDGINWTTHTITTKENMSITSIAYSEEKELFVAVGNRLSKYISSDAENWINTYYSFSSSTAYKFVTCVGNRFIAVLDAYISCTSNADKWYTFGNFPELKASGISDFAYSEKLGIFVAVGTCLDGVQNKATIYTSVFKSENLISNLTEDSDMSISLDVGENDILYFDDNNLEVELKYRQKYIGV